MLKSVRALGWLLAVAPLASYAFPITFQGELGRNTTMTGSIQEPSPAVDAATSSNDDFWYFDGTAGQSITLTANRLEAGLDTAFALYELPDVPIEDVTDTSQFSFIDGTDRDDDIDPLVGGVFGDPQLKDFQLPTTGRYALWVYSKNSGDAGADGVFDYQVSLAVPEPVTLSLMGIGLLGMGAAQRFGRRQSRRG